jgi:hypothetical protein
MFTNFTNHYIPQLSETDRNGFLVVLEPPTPYSLHQWSQLLH